MISWWQNILFPFAVLYDAITKVRNLLYDKGCINAISFDVTIISVGNLSVGGTGKTPMVDYLIQYLLNDGYAVATLSRGYGRKTKGFRICSADDSPKTVGDEPFMYYEKYKRQVVVAVGEDRVLAIPNILKNHPEVNVILLDDAFQHRSVKPSLSLLLTTQNRPFWKDYLLPMGRLRESRKGYKRADAIIVTKCKKENKKDAFSISKPTFHTAVNYNQPVFFFGEKLNKQVVAVAGLANNQPFFDYLSKDYDIIKRFSFPDHKKYAKNDIAKICNYLKEGVTLITTQKDMVKLKRFDELARFHCVYIPISVKFMEGEQEFQKLVNKVL